MKRNLLIGAVVGTLMVSTALVQSTANAAAELEGFTSGIRSNAIGTIPGGVPGVMDTRPSSLALPSVAVRTPTARASAFEFAPPPLAMATATAMPRSDMERDGVGMSRASAREPSSPYESGDEADDREHVGVQCGKALLDSMHRRMKDEMAEFMMPVQRALAEAKAENARLRRELIEARANAADAEELESLRAQVRGLSHISGQFMEMGGMIKSLVERATPRVEAKLGDRPSAMAGSRFGESSDAPFVGHSASAAGFDDDAPSARGRAESGDFEDSGASFGATAERPRELGSAQSGSLSDASHALELPRSAPSALSMSGMGAAPSPVKGKKGKEVGDKTSLFD